MCYEVRCGGVSQGLMDEGEARDCYDKNARSPLYRELIRIEGDRKIVVESSKGKGFKLQSIAHARV